MAFLKELQSARDEFHGLPKDAQELQIVLMMKREASCTQPQPVVVDADRGSSCPTSDTEGGEERATTKQDDYCPTSGDENDCPTSEEAAASTAPVPATKKRRYAKRRCAPSGTNFLDVLICRAALKYFIGIGLSRIGRLMEGRLDLRTATVTGQYGQTLKMPRKDGIFNNVMDFLVVAM